MSAKLIIVWKIMTRLKNSYFKEGIYVVKNKLKLKILHLFSERNKKVVETNLELVVEFRTFPIPFIFPSHLNSNQLKTFAFMMFQKLFTSLKIITRVSKIIPNTSLYFIYKQKSNIYVSKNKNGPCIKHGKNFSHTIPSPCNNQLEQRKKFSWWKFFSTHMELCIGFCLLFHLINHYCTCYKKFCLKYNNKKRNY